MRTFGFLHQDAFLSETNTRFLKHPVMCQNSRLTENGKLKNCLEKAIAALPFFMSASALSAFSLIIRHQYLYFLIPKWKKSI